MANVIDVEVMGRDYDIIENLYLETYDEYVPEETNHRHYDKIVENFKNLSIKTDRSFKVRFNDEGEDYIEEILFSPNVVSHHLGYPTYIWDNWVDMD